MAYGSDHSVSRNYNSPAYTGSQAPATQASTHEPNTGDLQRLSIADPQQASEQPRQIGTRRVESLEELAVSIKQHFEQIILQGTLSIAELNELIASLDRLRAAGHPSAAVLCQEACKFGLLPFSADLLLSRLQTPEHRTQSIGSCLIHLLQLRTSGVIGELDLNADRVASILEMLAKLGNECVDILFGDAKASIYTFRQKLVSDRGLEDCLKQYQQQALEYLAQVRSRAGEPEIETKAAQPVIPSVSGDISVALKSYLEFFRVREKGLGQRVSKEPLMPEKYNTPEKINQELLALQQVTEGPSAADARIFYRKVERALSHLDEKIFSHGSENENERIREAVRVYLQAVKDFIEASCPPLPATDDSCQGIESVPFETLLAELESNKETNLAVVFEIHQEISRRFPGTARGRDAQLEMIRICLTGDYGEGRKLLPPTQVLEWLVNLTLEGDFRAQYYLESTERHPVYGEQFHRQNAVETLETLRRRQNQEIESCLQEQGQGRFQNDDQDSPRLLDSLNDILPEPGLLSQRLSLNDIAQPWDEGHEHDSFGLENELPSLAAAREHGHYWGAMEQASLRSIAHTGPAAGLRSLGVLESLKPTEALLNRNYVYADDALFQRIKEWENDKEKAVTEKRVKPQNSQFFVKTLVGGTVTLDGIDLNGPVADLCMQLQKKGLPFSSTRIIFEGQQINYRESFASQMNRRGHHLLATTTVHAVIRDSRLQRHLQDFLNSKVSKPDGEIVPTMPHRFNSIAKIEQVLMRLYDAAKGGEVRPVTAKEYLDLSSCISQAREYLASPDCSKHCLKEGDFVSADEISNYLDAIMRCLDIYKLPFIDHQHQHVKIYLDQATRALQSIEGRMRFLRPVQNGPKCEVIVGNDRFHVDKTLLTSRCPYIQHAMSFDNVEHVSFSHEPAGPALDALQEYLKTGVDSGLISLLQTTL